MKKKTPKSPKLRTLTCYVCGKEYQNYISPSEIAQNIRRVCSKECKSKLNSMDKSRKVPVICKKCKKEFWVSPSTLKRGVQYCSMKCKMKRADGKSLSTDGYFVKNGIKEQRAVMEAYLGRKLKPTEIVHHINENKLDNRIENLQIVTRAEHNRIHGQFKAGSQHMNAVLTEEQVVEMRKLYKKGVSKGELAKRYGVSPTMSGRIIRRLAWKHV